MAVSLVRRTPLYHNPYNGDPYNGTPNLGNPYVDDFEKLLLTNSQKGKPQSPHPKAGPKL